MSDAISITPAAIIGVIMGLSLILGIVIFGGGILRLFTPVVDEGSINNFNGLVGYIKSAVENKNQLISNFKEGGRPYYLANGVILVGYDYNKDKQHTDCSNEYATKPSQLLGKAGLCLHVEDYANNFDDDPQQPIQCYPFDKKVIFLTNSDGSRKGGFGGSSNKGGNFGDGKQEQYEDLFLYGDRCGGGDLGTIRLYIEKYTIGDEVYIYLDEFNENTKDRIKDRWDRISKPKL